MNLANKLANKAPERQHPRQVLPAVARDGEAHCSMSFQKPAAFAFILFLGEGSPTGVFFSGGRIGGLFSDGGLTGGFFGSFGGSLLGDLATFFMESILMPLTPKESSIRAYRNVCKVFLHSPCSNDRRRILARS